MPANAQTVFAILLKIAAFDMIPAEQMYEKMINELEGTSSEEPDFLQERMESSGFDTIWILPNLGSVVIFLGLYLLLIVIYLLMACLVIRCIPKVGKRAHKMKNFIFWNWPIIFLRDNFIVIITCALYNAKYADWSIFESWVNSGLSFAILSMLITYTILFHVFLYCRRKSLSKKAFAAKYGSSYEGLDTRYSGFILYPMIFYLRRILVPMSIILFPKFFVLHYFMITMTGIATIIIIGYQKPF